MLRSASNENKATCSSSLGFRNECRGKIDAERINKLIMYKEGSGARRELVSVFNFIPFYLPFISKDLDRIVYLDADVVVVVSNLPIQACFSQ